MYKKETQLAFEDFVFPFGELDSENEWVKLAGLIPWDTVERAYAKQFVDNGHPAHSARIALGALIIKQRLKCSDEWTVRHVSENPYLQFFLGMKAYSSKAPFGASTMWSSASVFRRRPLRRFWRPASQRKPVRIMTTRESQTGAVDRKQRSLSRRHRQTAEHCSWMRPAARLISPFRRISNS